MMKATEQKSTQQLKKKRRIKKKRAIREQEGSDASNGGSERHIFLLYEGEKENIRRLPKAVQDPTKGSFKLTDRQQRRTMMSPEGCSRERIHLPRAEMALKLYEKSQDDEFEILEVLESNGTFVEHPYYGIYRLWIHISFIAKSKNDGSPKYFFGELYRDDRTANYHAAYCSTFEPSDDPEVEHGCVFCPPQLKYHPSKGYFVGCPPCHAWVYIDPWVCRLLSMLLRHGDVIETCGRSEQHRLFGRHIIST